MTDEDIVRRAGSDWARTRGTMGSYLKLVIKYAREAEREACAQACEETDRHRREYFANKIRARGGK